MMIWIGLRSVIVAFPGPTRLLFVNIPWTRQRTGILIRLYVAIGIDKSLLSHILLNIPNANSSC